MEAEVLAKVPAVPVVMVVAEGFNYSQERKFSRRLKSMTLEMKKEKLQWTQRIYKGS